MSFKHRTFAFLAAAALPLACTTTPHQAPEHGGAGYPETVFQGGDGIYVPDRNKVARDALPWAETAHYMSQGPYTISIDKLPPASEAPAAGWLRKDPDMGRIESPISDAMAERLRAEALKMAPNLSIRDGLDAPGLNGPAANTAFDSLDANDCCGGTTLTVPPDPELAVGPNHIIAVVNVALAIYDKSGNELVAPTTFESFFSGVPGCTGVFDPNAIYDEEHDRFIIAIDADGTDYCIAATTGSDPTGSWNRYSFATDIGGNFFDYPHAGVGLDAIYMGANMFGSTSFAEGRIWAIDKFAMYNGTALSVVSRSTGLDGTPQPMNLHGWAQGTWPTGGPHYIMTDGPSFNGEDYGVWSWNDPFGANDLTNEGTVDLNAASGVTAGFPIDADQAGSNIDLQSGDWRVLDAEYRNGFIWMANTIACNPGGGTVDCVRWAQVDPTGPSVVDAGVLGSSGEFRFHPDLAADDCNNMAIGYTKSSSSSFPSVYVAGRESTDTPGTLQAEQLVKAGERDYDSFQSGFSHRWGDYTGMTIDPDGTTFWYLGEYSKDITNFNTTTWGNYIASFSFESCDGGGPTDPPAAASNPNPDNGLGGVSIETDLSWTAGAGATSHDVYFGTTTGGVSFQGNQSGTSFDPGTLQYATEYSWRIDEVNSVGTTGGTTWTFTTEDEPVPNPTMHLAGLSGASAPASGPNWTATVTATVEDETDAPLGGVTVSGSWGRGGNGSCTTNGSGQCSVSNDVHKRFETETFTVNDLSASGYDYAPGDNEVNNVITVSQTDQNQTPNAQNDNYSTEQDTQLSGVNVLANDDEGDAPATVTAFDSTSANGGTVNITSGGDLTYGPPSGFTGDDTFSYTITDSDGDSDSATVTVQVTDPGSGGNYELTATGYKVRGVHTVDLIWSGFSTIVDITRNTSVVIATGEPASGSLTDDTGNKGGGATYVYEVCEQGSTTNCATASVSF